MGSKTIKGFAIICLFLCINGCGEHTQTGEAIKKNTQTDSLKNRQEILYLLIIRMPVICCVAEWQKPLIVLLSID